MNACIVHSPLFEEYASCNSYLVVKGDSRKKGSRVLRDEEAWKYLLLSESEEIFSGSEFDTENVLLYDVVNDGRNENDSVTQDFGRKNTQNYKGQKGEVLRVVSVLKALQNITEIMGTF